MSFVGKQYQHRFFTVPKMHSRHIDELLGSEITRSRYQSVINTSANSNPHTNNNNFPQQPPTMKESYLQLMSNQRNSRIYTKDQLGYEGLKFQKDVINRYSSNDYQQKADMLEKFKRQAQQLKRKKKYRHVNINNERENSYYNHSVEDQNHRLKTYRGENSSRVLQQNLHNQSISLLPITNNKTNVSRMTVLPQLKLPTIVPVNSNDFKSPVLEEDSQHNQNEFLEQDNHDEDSPFLSRVCDVGVTAHLSIESQVDKHHRRASQKLFIDNDESLITRRKKSQYTKLQILKSKNMNLKKKYEKLKKQLLRKQKEISKQRQVTHQAIENDQQFQQKIENLSQMIHTLCDKLRENNSKMLMKVKAVADNQDHGLLHESQVKVDNMYQNHTQINLSNFNINQDNEKISMSKMMRSRYVAKIEKIDSFEKARPKIVYTFNKDQKNVNIDPLRMLKNRLKQQKFNQSLHHNDFNSRRRIQTQHY